VAATIVIIQQNNAQLAMTIVEPTRPSTLSNNSNINHFHRSSCNHRHRRRPSRMQASGHIRDSHSLALARMTDHEAPLTIDTPSGLNRCNIPLRSIPLLSPPRPLNIPDLLRIPANRPIHRFHPMATLL